MDFYEQIRASISEETGDHDKYVKLAEIAPSDKARRILLDISREEHRHKEFLQEILADGKRDHSTPQHIPVQSASSAESHASNKVVAATAVPTVGII